MLSASSKKVDWTSSLFLMITPVIAMTLTIAYLYLHDFSWWMVAIFLGMYTLGGLSITAGYHRLWSHRTYKANFLVRLVYALFGAATFQNSIRKWAIDHRLHHRHVDTDNDPYSINKGFWFAHIGWMFVQQKDHPSRRAYARDLDKDSIVVWQHKYYGLIAISVGLGLPTLLGYFAGSALGGLAIGGFLRMVALHHSTFLINSAAHWWGRQNYTDSNTAKDNPILAFFTFGEGYHNFHHFFDNDYRNGIRWYDWDPTKWLIQCKAWFGLAKDLKTTPEDKILEAKLLMEKKRTEQLGMGHEKAWQEQVQYLKDRVLDTHVKLKQLKSEYYRLRREKAEASKIKIQLLKQEIRLAKMEMATALTRWRTFMMATQINALA